MCCVAVQQHYSLLFLWRDGNGHSDQAHNESESENRLPSLNFIHLCLLWKSPYKLLLLQWTVLLLSKEICISLWTKLQFHWISTDIEGGWKGMNCAEFTLNCMQLTYSSLIAISWHPNPIRNPQVQYFPWSLMGYPGFHLSLLCWKSRWLQIMFSFPLVQVITADPCPLHGSWL